MPVLLLLSMTGCRTIREYDKTTSITDLSYIEREYISRIESSRDTTIRLRLPLQQSVSIGLDTSFLETDYSQSKAWIDAQGKLNHTLQNKSFVDVVVPGGIRETKESSVTEIDHQEENRSDKSLKEYVEKFRFMNAFFYYSGLTFYALLLLWGLIKTIKK